jgi:hypothetical protein
VRELLDKQGNVLTGGAPGRFAALVEAEPARWQQVASAGTQAD